MGKLDKLIFELKERRAIVEWSPIVGKYAVRFYYDGYSDYEWKRGSHGIPCDLCDSRAQAIKKAKYYVRKSA